MLIDDDFSQTLFFSDFAHVEKSSELDESYIVGLQTLVKIFSLGLDEDNDEDFAGKGK